MRFPGGVTHIVAEQQVAMHVICKLLNVHCIDILGIDPTLRLVDSSVMRPFGCVT